MDKQLVIPEPFVRFMHAVHGSAGEHWVAELPGLLATCADEWDLRLEEPFSNLTYNYVVRCTTQDGRKAVLKVGVPHPELFSEMDALEAFAGCGAVRLLAADRDKAAVLLECIEPGTPLTAVDNDAEATRIAARVMCVLWKPPPDQHNFKHVSDLVAGFERLRARFNGAAGPLPEWRILDAERMSAELLQSREIADVLLHGDLHHDNILDAGNGCWLAIDPKGVVGPPGYDVGTLLTNPIADIPDRPDLERLLARRLDFIAEELDHDRETLRRWGIMKATLAAWWDVEDNSGDPNRWFRIADALDTIS